MRYLPEATACLLGVLLAAPAAADDKDRFKEAHKRQREFQKEYEKRLREDQKRQEEWAREERKRYEERLREGARRQREFERDRWERDRDRDDWGRGGFGGYPGQSFHPGYQPTYQYPDQGYPSAQPGIPYGGAGYPSFQSAYPQSVYPGAGYAQPAYGQPAYEFGGRTYGFGGSVSSPRAGVYGFSGQLRVVPLPPPQVYPTYPRSYYP